MDATESSILLTLKHSMRDAEDFSSVEIPQSIKNEK